MRDAGERALVGEAVVFLRLRDRRDELHARYAYPAALLVMAAVAASIVWYFKRRRWL